MVHASLVQNFSKQFFWNINPSFWSIAIEWQLYLVYPIVLFLIIRLGNTYTLLLCAAISLVIQLFVSDHLFAVRHSPFAYWFEWVCGAFIAEHFWDKDSAWASKWLLNSWSVTAGLLVLCTCYLFVDQQAVRQFLATLVFTQILCASLYWKCSGDGILVRSLSRIGVLSYSLYLIHQPLVIALAKLMSILSLTSSIYTMAVGPVVYFSAMFCLAGAYYRTIEVRSIELGKRVSMLMLE